MDRDSPGPPLQHGSTGPPAQTITYAGRNGDGRTGFLAHPSGDGTYPPVVVIQEWWGVDDHVMDVTRRFARAGFLAMAPDLYHGAVATEPSDAKKLLMELDVDQAVSEIGQAVAYLLQHPRAKGESVGVVGFCMGGRLAFRVAEVTPDVGAVVVFYGHPPEPDAAERVQAPILGLFGGQDAGIPVDTIRTFDEALTEARVEHEFVVYPQAGHAFFNDTRSRHDADASADAWNRTVAWLNDHLDPTAR
jgi:carboxymethylenebutenolidase